MSAYGPGFQVPLAERIKQAVGLPTPSVGMITHPYQGEDIVANGRADGVAIARGLVLRRKKFLDLTTCGNNSWA